MRQPEFIIEIAADSVAQLRRVDLERIFHNCSDEELQPTARWIAQNRMDLATKVEQELDFQLDERRGA